MEARRSDSSVEENKEKQSNKERSRRARVRKKRYIEELEGKVKELENWNAVLKEECERLQHQDVYKKAGGKAEKFESYAKKGNTTQKTLENLDPKEQKISVAKLKEGHDLWNEGRMRILDQAKLFVIENIIPDYLKYEFSLCHY